ncbi:MAG: hypothetical protein WA096_12790 [Smithella sp.]
MLKHNFIKIIAFILISSFFFSSSVYAKMQAMSENDLMRIDAETGITIALNTDAYLKATSIGLFTTTAETSGIVLPNVVIDGTLDTTSDNFTNPSAVNVNSTLVADVGTASGKTWLNISGLNIYNPMGLTSKGIYIEDGANDRILGDLYIRGVFMGRTLTNGTSGYTPPGNTQTFTMGETPFVRLGSHTGGLDLYASLNAYINTLEYRFSPADSSNEFKVSGIYACNSFSGTVETPSTWAGSGNLSIGLYDPPLYDVPGETDYPATIDVGTLSGKTYLNLNLPLSGSIRINDFRMDSSFSLGPVAVDGLVTKSLSLTLYSL